MARSSKNNTQARITRLEDMSQNISRKLDEIHADVKPIPVLTEKIKKLEADMNDIKGRMTAVEKFRYIMYGIGLSVASGMAVLFIKLVFKL